MDQPGENQRKQRLQTALYEYCTTTSSFKATAEKYEVPKTTLQRAYNRWRKSNPNATPSDPHDVQLTKPSVGRPPTLTENEEKVIVGAALQYADNSTPLTKTDLLSLAGETVEMFWRPNDKKISFTNQIPTKSWLKGFLRRNAELIVRPVRTIEASRIASVTLENVCEHISRVDEAIKRFNIRDPNRIFNCDETGIILNKSSRRTLRKGVGGAHKTLQQIEIVTKGGLDHVTLMGIVSASGNAYKPAIIFPGKHARYRIVNGNVETMHTCLPPCYFYQKDPAGMNSQIFIDWARHFLNETEPLRRNGNHILLVYDGYKCHIQYEVLSLFKTSRVVVIGLPAHTSHVLQPLDVSVFCSFKSVLQREFHRATRTKRILDCFDVGTIITASYYDAFTRRNIQDGFLRTGLWNHAKQSAAMDALEEHPSFVSLSCTRSVADVMRMFDAKRRSLLRDSDVDITGTVAVDTTAGAHLTADCIVEALEKRNKRRVAAKNVISERISQQEHRTLYPESSSDVAHLLCLSARRKTLASILHRTRKKRRERAAARVAARAMLLCSQNNPSVM